MTMLDRWNTVVPIFDEFHSFLSAKVQRLHLQQACDRAWSNERYLEERRTGIYQRYGVYLIFDSSDSLRYVGVAMNAFDDRIWAKLHDQYRKWTDVIAFEHANYFLAPALECLLIVRLKPPENTLYGQHSIVCVD